MPFDWREFLVIAHELRNDPREGVQRACLGRAYYYVYHLGLDTARGMTFTETMPSLHKKLWRWCQQQADPTIKKVGLRGSRMLSLRHDADYDSGAIQNLPGEVILQLNRAREIEELIAQTTGQAAPPALAPSQSDIP